MKKRLFLAIQLPKALKDSFLAYSKEYYNATGIRWTAPENLHITVYFLGYVDERDVSDIIEKIDNILVKVRPFNLELQQIEFAPPARPARMIWAVFADKNGEYKNFVDTVYNELKEFSPKDFRGRERIAHVTVARFNNPSCLKSLVLKQPDAAGKAFKVSSINLMESKLSSKGPTYKIVHNFHLS